MTTEIIPAANEQLETIIADRIKSKLGALPTIDTLKADGYKEDRRANAIIDWINNAGRVITLFVAEFAQAFAPAVLAVLFIALEAERITSGVMALGQGQAQAIGVAIAFTSANFILPQYQLRNVQNQATLTRQRGTLLGYVIVFLRRVFWMPETYKVSPQDNPTLAIMESAVTWATIFLALYAVMGPMLAKYSDQIWYNAIWLMLSKSNPAQFIELIAGALISIGGVFGVQSISWEFGVRRAIDKPQRLADVVEAKRLEYNARAAQIREETLAQQKMITITPVETQPAPAPEVAAVVSPLALTISQNGHNHQ